MTRDDACKAEVKARLHELQASFPTLAMTLDEHPRYPGVDVVATFPQQPGLSFDIDISLQGDALHLNVRDIFSMEYFPCDNPARLAAGIHDIRGLLAGDYCIVVHYRRDRPFHAELQNVAEARRAGRTPSEADADEYVRVIQNNEQSL